MVLYVVMVRTGWGQRLDNAAVAGRTTRETVLRATDRVLNTISAGSLVLAGTAIALLAFARRRPHLAVTAVGVVAGANITTQLLKRALTRPELAGEPDPLLGGSYPSGHSTVAMSLAVALILVVPARWRSATAVVACGYAALVGTGTVTAGWHRPSDVIAGYLVAIAWAAFGTMALIAWQGAVVARGTSSRLPLLPPVLVGGGVAFLSVGLLGFAAVVVADRERELDAVDLEGSYALALVSIVGVALLLVAALVVALRRVDLDPTAEEERDAGVAVAE